MSPVAAPAPSPAAFQPTRGRPSWTSDSTKVAVEVDRGVLVVDRGGQVVDHLGPSDSWVSNAAFSPDGSKVAYCTYTTPPGQSLPSWGLHVADVGGTNDRVLTWHLGWQPAWSPDARQLTFTSDAQNDFTTAVIDPDGGNEHIISKNGAFEIRHSWNPNGQEVAYESAHSEDGFGIYAVDKTGTTQREITTHDDFVTDQNPTWSPDGKQIVFERTSPEGDTALFLVDAQGGSAKAILGYQKGYHQLDPSWSPDGQSIAFASDVHGSMDIYTMHADGSGMKQITDAHTQEYNPAWSPDGKSIAYLTLNEGAPDGYGIAQA